MAYRLILSRTATFVSEDAVKVLAQDLTADLCCLLPAPVVVVDHARIASLPIVPSSVSMYRYIRSATVRGVIAIFVVLRNETPDMA